MEEMLRPNERPHPIPSAEPKASGAQREGFEVGEVRKLLGISLEDPTKEGRFEMKIEFRAVACAMFFLSTLSSCKLSKADQFDLFCQGSGWNGPIIYHVDEAMRSICARDCRVMMKIDDLNEKGFNAKLDRGSEGSANVAFNRDTGDFTLSFYSMASSSVMVGKCVERPFSGFRH